MTGRPVRPLLRLRQFGVEAIARRLAFMVRRRLGILKRRCRAQSWEAINIRQFLNDGVPFTAEGYARFRPEKAPRFLFPWGGPPSSEALMRLLGDSGKGDLIAEAADLKVGRFRFFRHAVHDLGAPPDWLRNPENGYRYNAESHWCDVPDFAPEQGDIKLVWEPSRFAGAFVLARAWALTGDESYAETFWSLFESWCDQNPPNRGPNWKCGQEASLRLMAWVFALYATAGARATRPERLMAMLKAVVVLGHRVEANIGYALSQNNNHGISEATGLLTIGLLFPELRRAAVWARKGLKLLERQVRRQVYADGAYVQHSFNYQRLMLHDCLWAATIARRNGMGLSPEVLDRLRSSAGFLYQMSDPGGALPNYGKNDGALVLVLDACDYRDYRPLLQLSARVLEAGRRIESEGPWDEPGLWFFAEGEADAGPALDATRESTSAPDGGYVTIRRKDAWAMIRAHRYRDRPADADALHFDLWWRGRNLLRDSGTYRYYCEQRFGDYFAATRAHNTIEIDVQSQMDKAGVFLWDQWLSARTTRHETLSDGVILWEGEHDGYHRLPDPVTHHRAVLALSDRLWVVIDDVLGRTQHDVGLFWHIGDVECQLADSGRSIRMTSGDEVAELLIHAGVENADIRYWHGYDDQATVHGWRSLYYATKTAAATVQVAVRRTLPVRLVSAVVLGAAEGSLEVAGDLCTINLSAGGQKWTLSLNPPDKARGTIVKRVGQADALK